MSNLFEGLDCFMEYKHNDYYVKIGGDPKQFICRLDYSTVKLAIVIVMDCNKEYDECCKDIQDIIVSIFKDLEWELVYDIDKFKEILKNMLSIVFDKLVNTFTHDFKQIILMSLNKYTDIMEGINHG